MTPPVTDIWSARDLRPEAWRQAESRPILCVFNEKQGDQAPLFNLHQELEVGIVLKGVMKWYFEEETFDLGAGDVWLCNMWEPHGSELLDGPCFSAQWKIAPYVLAGLRNDELAGVNWFSLFGGLPSSRSRRAHQRRKRVVGLGRRVQEMLESQSPREDVWVRLYLEELLLTLLEADGSADASANLSDHSPDRIAPALRLVFHARRFVTTEEAATACRMRRNQFIDVFRSIMGEAFGQFSMRHRLSGAAEQIRRTSLPIKAVAADWGFADASHLHRHFKANYGCSPKEYRQRLGAE